MKRYRVIYQARNDSYWCVWKNNIRTYEDAEKARLQAVEIFGTPVRIQSY